MNSKVNCDQCGHSMEDDGHPSGIHVCPSCKQGRPSLETLMGDLEAQGVGIRNFIRAIHAALERAKSK